MPEETDFEVNTSSAASVGAGVCYGSAHVGGDGKIVGWAAQGETRERAKAKALADAEAWLRSALAAVVAARARSGS